MNTIISLFDAGMSLARFNMSHGTQKVSPAAHKPYLCVDQRISPAQVPGSKAFAPIQDLCTHDGSERQSRAHLFLQKADLVVPR